MCVCVVPQNVQEVHVQKPLLVLPTRQTIHVGLARTIYIHSVYTVLKANHTRRAGQNHIYTIYIYSVYTGFHGREITKYTVIYSIQFIYTVLANPT